jgi:hypothetical protein
MSRATLGWPAWFGLGKGKDVPGQDSDFAQGESAAEEGLKQREGGKKVALKVEVPIDEGFAQGEFEGRGEHPPQCAGVVEDQAKGRTSGRR